MVASEPAHTVHVVLQLREAVGVDFERVHVVKVSEPPPVMALQRRPRSLHKQACGQRDGGRGSAPCVRAYRANDSVLPPTQAVASVTERRLVQGRFTLSCRCAPTSMMARRNSEIRSAVYLAAKRQPRGWCKRGGTGGNNPCYASRAAAPK